MEKLEKIKQEIVLNFADNDEELINMILKAFKALKPDFKKQTVKPFGYALYPLYICRYAILNKSSDETFDDEAKNNALERFNNLIKKIRKSDEIYFKYLTKEMIEKDIKNKADFILDIDMFELELGQFIKNLSSRNKGFILYAFYGAIYYTLHSFSPLQYDAICHAYKKAVDQEELELKSKVDVNKLPDYNKFSGANQKEKKLNVLAYLKKKTHMRLISRISLIVLIILSCLGLTLLGYSLFGIYSDEPFYLIALDINGGLVLLTKYSEPMELLFFSLTTFEEVINVYAIIGTIIFLVCLILSVVILIISFIKREKYSNLYKLYMSINFQK